MQSGHNKISTNFEDKKTGSLINEFFITGISAFICVFTLCYWHSVAKGDHSYQAFLFALLFITTNYLWGIIFIGLIRGKQLLPFSGFLGAILIGSCIVCVLSFFLKIAVPLPTIAVLPILLVAGLSCIALMLKKKAILPDYFSSEITSLWALIICLLIAVLWSKSLVMPFQIAEDVVIFKPWIDYFIHAGITDLFRYGLNIIETGNFEMAGLPVTFYHYASYMVPIQYSAFTDTDVMTAVTSIWFSYGMFLMVVSGYVLFNAWAGPAAGLGAIAAMTLVPDAASYGFQVGWFGYYWMFLAHPTLLYGVGISAAAVFFVVQGCRFACVRTLSLGLIRGLLTLFF